MWAEITTPKILNIGTDWSAQIVLTQIRLQSEQSVQCSPFHLLLLDVKPNSPISRQLPYLFYVSQFKKFLYVAIFLSESVATFLK